MKRFAGWFMASPATLAVVVFLILPVAATISVTFTDPRGLLGPYVWYFESGFRRTVLWRTFEIAFATTVIALFVGFLTAYVVSKSPPWLKSILIVLAVFPLLTGVVVRSFAWLIVLGRNGILNNFMQWLGLTDAPVTMLYTQGAVIVAMVLPAYCSPTRRSTICSVRGMSCMSPRIATPPSARRSRRSTARSRSRRALPCGVGRGRAGTPETRSRP
jgi:ABC-type spermidine/putrescine transport system permease subunit I